MRGKEDFQSQTLLNLRITPAYAGKSPSARELFNPK